MLEMTQMPAQRDFERAQTTVILKEGGGRSTGIFDVSISITMNVEICDSR